MPNLLKLSDLRPYGQHFALVYLKYKHITHYMFVFPF